MKEGRNKKGILAFVSAMLIASFLLVSVGELVRASPRWIIPTGIAPVGSSTEELEESIWMRTKNSQVFHSYTEHQDYHDIYLDAIHYEVGHNREIETYTDNETIYWETWEDIDNTLEPAGELSPWDWQMVKADYNVYMLEDFTSGQILKFEKADPHGSVLGDVAFQPMALQWTNNLDQIQEVSMPQSGIPSVVDNRIEWENAYGSGIDFSWTCSSTRLLKLLTISSLNDLSTPEQYILDGGNPVLELNLIFDPTKELDIFVDGSSWDKSSEVQSWFSIIEFKLDGTTLWGFMPLRVWDSSGNNEITVMQKLRKVGNKLYVSTRVPYGWIQNATFPIYIDTVVDEWIEASSDDAHELVSDGSVDLTNTIVDLGSYAGETHAGFRFTGVDTTDVEHIEIAYLEFYPAQDDSGAVSYAWYGENTANATTFNSDAYNISGRDRTTANMVENPPVDWATDTQVQTADLAGILNEIFSREDWVSGNNLAILNIYNSGNGERRLRSWDYNDHAKAPKLHFENPTEVTYYWDDGGVGWADATKAFDGGLGTFAYTSTDGNYMRGSSTTCDGTDLGTIIKVELRCYGYGDGDDRIDLSFGGSPTTPEYQLVMPASEDWSIYADVTADTNVDGWTWAKVADLFGETTDQLILEYDKSGKGNPMYVAKVEIRVTSEEGGCTPNIDNSPISKAYGIVAENNTYETGLTNFTVSNNSGGAITITIQATDFTGGNGWTLSDTATPDADTAGLKAGVEGGDYTIVVKKTGPYNILVTGLADTTTQKWGLKLYTPTSYSDGVEKSSIVTLTATCD